MVGLVGNAPTTSSMSMRHSTFELKALNLSYCLNRKDATFFFCSKLSELTFEIHL